MKNYWVWFLVCNLCCSCASTRYTVYDPVTGQKRIDAKLSGNYGMVPTLAERGSLGSGGGGTGLLGSLLPGFNYKDDSRRSFVEAQQPTRISVTESGLLIEGVVDHSTSQDIQGAAVNRGIRNVATLVGWLKTLNTVEAVNLANEITKRAEITGKTNVQLQELFTQAELAEIDAGLQTSLATIEATPVVPTAP